MSNKLTSLESRTVVNNGIWGSGHTVPTAGLNIVGQNGIGLEYRALDASVPQVRQDVICVLLEAPRGLAYLPNPEYWYAGIKEIFESLPDSIEGLDQTIKTEMVTRNIGATEVISTIGRTTRERSEPTHKYTDGLGYNISRFFDMYQIMLYADPVTGTPGIVTLPGNEKLTQPDGANQAFAHTPDWISSTAIYIEADITKTYALNAWLVTAMMPENSGDRTGSRDLQGGNDKSEFSVKFTGVQEINAGVRKLANNILSMINKGGLSDVARQSSIGHTLQEALSAELVNVKAVDGKNMEREAGVIGQSEKFRSESDILLP